VGSRADAPYPEEGTHIISIYRIDLNELL